MMLLAYACTLHIISISFNGVRNGTTQFNCNKKMVRATGPENRLTVCMCACLMCSEFSTFKWQTTRFSINPVNSLLLYVMSFFQNEIVLFICYFPEFQHGKRAANTILTA